MIDIVLPYVDMDDRAWQDIFLKAKHLPAHTPHLRDVMLRPFTSRYSGHGLLRYWFRALHANVRFPYRVQLLLMHEAQRPTFLIPDCDILQTHYHRDFMPAHLRPSFNSSAIELCAMHALELSPIALFANDDMYFNQPCDESCFVSDGRPCTHIAYKPSYGAGLFQVALENGRRLVEKHTGRKCPTYAWHHVIQAYDTAYCKEFLDMHWGEIAPRLGRFRCASDCNHLMLMMLQDLEGVSVDSPNYPWEGYYELPTLGSVPIKELTSRRVICLNDTDGTHAGAALRYLAGRYPDRCPFERE